MKAFFDWLLARRQRLVIVAVAATPLLPMVTAALLVLETAKRGVRSGVISAALVVAGLCLLAALSRSSIPLFAATGIVSAALGVGIGELLRRVDNLVFAFQAVVLGSLLLVLLNGLVGPDPEIVFAPVLREFEVVLQPPAYTEAEVVEVTRLLAAILPAVMVFWAFTTVLLLGFWVWTVAEGNTRFGDEFRRLALGRWLGAVMTLIAALGLVFSAPLVQTLLPLALFAFIVQGLAVVHAWAAARRWHVGLVVLLYFALLLPPLTVLVMLPLSMVGLIDCWLNLRAPLRPAT